MQHTTTSRRRRLSAAARQRLAMLRELRGEVALSIELRVTRQTISRALADLPLNSATHAALSGALDTP